MKRIYWIKQDSPARIVSWGDDGVAINFVNEPEFVSMTTAQRSAVERVVAEALGA